MSYREKWFCSKIKLNLFIFLFLFLIFCCKAFQSPWYTLILRGHLKGLIIELTPRFSVSYSNHLSLNTLGKASFINVFSVVYTGSIYLDLRIAVEFSFTLRYVYLSWQSMWTFKGKLIFSSFQFRIYKPNRGYVCVCEWMRVGWRSSFINWLEE